MTLQQFLEKLSQLPKEEYELYKKERYIILRLKHQNFIFALCPIAAVYHYQNKEDISNKSALFMGKYIGLEEEDIYQIVNAADGYTNELHYKLKGIMENLS